MNKVMHGKIIVCIWQEKLKTLLMAENLSFFVYFVLTQWKHVIRGRTNGTVLYCKDIHAT